jgi:hypothetical protein
MSQTVAAGNSVTFISSASGSPTPTYQWRKNGKRIYGATNPWFTIASAATGDAGTYSVVASNSVGSATSVGAVLTVTTSAPEFTVQPASRTVIAGASVTFTAAAAGAPTPSYQWWRNGRKIIGANKASYTIASVSSASAGTYFVVATNSAGSTTSANAVLKLVSAASIAPVDFNLDGFSDIVWQNGTTHEASIWLMNGTVKVGLVSLGLVDPDWSIAGVGDFDRDGNPDLLWQNLATGERLLWLMNGTSQGSVVSLGVVSLDWTIAGTGDFNADGRTDLVWQNLLTGERTVWLMNGTTQAGTVSLGVVGADWSIVGTGDFNGDGCTDLVWQNAATGERTVWLMNGTTQVGTVSLGMVSTDWSIAGTGDFNDDGRPDLVWQNAVTGERMIWLMYGSTQIRTVSLGLVSTDWSIQQ